MEPAAAGGEVTNDSHLTLLGVVLWTLALHGSRAALLPEIAGPVFYRRAPKTGFSMLSLGGPLALASNRRLNFLPPSTARADGSCWDWAGSASACLRFTVSTPSCYISTDTENDCQLSEKLTVGPGKERKGRQRTS